MTPDRLVAKLSFGFWTALCNSAYEQTRASGPGLWPGILKYSFVFAPKRHRNRPDILRRVDEIRELRNRVSHHEPIWEWDLPAWNARILETLSWMNGAIAEATRRRSRLEAVFAAGPEAYRPDAEELIGGGAAPGVARPGA